MATTDDVPTKADIRAVATEVVQEAGDAILAALETLFAKLEASNKHIRRELSDLKLDTAARKVVEELKAKVERYHPTN